MTALVAAFRGSVSWDGRQGQQAAAVGLRSSEAVGQQFADQVGVSDFQFTVEDSSADGDGFAVPAEAEHRAVADGEAGMALWVVDDPEASGGGALQQPAFLVGDGDVCGGFGVLLRVVGAD